MYDMVHMCFVDEAGDAAAYGPAIPDAPPAFVLVGMTVPQPSAKDLTWGFLQLKKEFEPALRHVALSDLVCQNSKGRPSARTSVRRTGTGAAAPWASSTRRFGSSRTTTAYCQGRS